jgi:hypothetical protein
VRRDNLPRPLLKKKGIELLPLIKGGWEELGLENRVISPNPFRKEGNVWFPLF